MPSDNETLDEPITANTDAAQCDRLVQRAAETLGLAITLRTRLASVGDAPHWHLKQGSAAGTLEVTYWPEANAFTTSYHVNRVGDGWVTEFAPLLLAALQNA